MLKRSLWTSDHRPHPEPAGAIGWQERDEKCQRKLCKRGLVMAWRTFGSTLIRAGGMAGEGKNADAPGWSNPKMPARTSPSRSMRSPTRYRADARDRAPSRGGTPICGGTKRLGRSRLPRVRGRARSRTMVRSAASICPRAGVHDRRMDETRTSGPGFKSVISPHTRPRKVGACRALTAAQAGVNVVFLVVDTRRPSYAETALSDDVMFLVFR